MEPATPSLCSACPSHYRQSRPATFIFLTCFDGITLERQKNLTRKVAHSGGMKLKVTSREQRLLQQSSAESRGSAAMLEKGSLKYLHMFVRGDLGLRLWHFLCRLLDSGERVVRFVNTTSVSDLGRVDLGFFD